MNDSPTTSAPAADHPVTILPREWWFVAALSIVAFALMMWVSLTMWLNGAWGLNDVGNVANMMFNTLHGRFMWSPDIEACHFAYHFTPLLVGLSPITLLSDYPVPLVAAYVGSLAASAFPIYALARGRFALSSPLAAAVALLFLCNHFTASVHLANHFESFFILGALTTMALAYDKRPWPFWIAAALTLSVKEDAPVWLALWAAFETFRPASDFIRRRCLKLIAICILYAGVAVLTILLTSRHEGAGAASYASRLEGFGLSGAALSAMLALAASFAFLPLAGGRWFFLMLTPTPLMLGSFEFTRSLLYYYSYPFLPYAVLASLAGLQRLTAWRSVPHGPPMTKQTIVSFALILVAFVQLLLPTRTDSIRRFPWEVNADDTHRLDVLRTHPPPDAPAVVQFGLWSLLPMRPEMRTLRETNLNHPGYVVIDTRLFPGIPAAESTRIFAQLEADLAARRRTMENPAGTLYIFSPLATPANQETTIAR